ALAGSWVTDDEETTATSGPDEATRADGVIEDLIHGTRPFPCCCRFLPAHGRLQAHFRSYKDVFLFFPQMLLLPFLASPAPPQKICSKGTEIKNQKSDEKMAFKSPSKIPRVEGEEFVKMRDQFCLLAYSLLDEDVSRQGVHQELTELGMRVLRKFAGLDAERKYLWKELVEVCRNLEKLKAALDFAKDNLEFDMEDGAEARMQETEKLEGELEVTKAALDCAKDVWKLIWRMVLKLRREIRTWCEASSAYIKRSEVIHTARPFDILNRGKQNLVGSKMPRKKGFRMRRTQRCIKSKSDANACISSEKLQLSVVAGTDVRAAPVVMHRLDVVLWLQSSM
ncbi:hypothetical protein QQF64_028866, partial [Cirrhinus molitorella]